jgi:hypothetical protein
LQRIVLKRFTERKALKMDIYNLLVEVNKKLDLLLKQHGIDYRAAKTEEENDSEYGRELARAVGPIRSDE